MGNSDISSMMTASHPSDDGPTSGAGAPGVPPGGAGREGAIGEKPGDQIGPYTLIDRVGQGGFGVVWLAERRTPFVQRVALKIIKPGMDSESVIARFEQERQALAVMDHPNVARVLDGGVTSREAGSRSYFVMEFVQGESLSAYCDSRRLGVRERLSLFVPVCRAVQHAHQKGIIHRDIKPTNILVREVEGAPVPKVIDFGIAKAIGPGVDAVVTQAGWIVGTPAYMSPEQATGDGRDIDTRTDVYSLGVVLYELLAGSPPVDPSRLESGSPAEMLRVIRETEAPRLRTRLMQPATRAMHGAAGAEPFAEALSAEEIASRRGTSVSELSRLLSGELEWIPQRAMRKERERRYQTPAELGDDVQRYLDGQPLRAGPESAAYLARKFVKRHTGAVAAGATVAAVLVAGVIATLIFAAAEHRQRVRAERGEAELKEVTDFLAAIISGVDPESAGAVIIERVVGDGADGLEADAREELVSRRREALEDVNAPEVARRVIDETMLAPAAAAIEERFAESPLVAASLRQTIAEAYMTLGQFDRARPLQEAALEARREHLGADARPTIQSMNNMGYLLLNIGEIDQSAMYYEDAMRRAERALGESDVDTLAFISNLGSARQAQGKLPEAEGLYQRAYEVSARVHGEESPDTLLFLNNVGGMQEAQGKLAEAESSYRRSMDGFIKATGEDSIDALIGMNNLGSVLESMGRLDEAEAYYKRSLEGRKRTLGREHPSTLLAVNNMAHFYMQRERNTEAEAILREGVGAAVAGLGPENPTTLTLRHNLSAALDRLGKHEESLAMTAEVLEARTRVLGAEHEATIATSRNMGRALVSAGRFEDAEASLLRTMATATEALPAGNGTRRTVVEALISLYEKWEERDPDKGHAQKAAPWRETLATPEAG